MTLVLLTLDLWHLVELSDPTHAFVLGPYWCATLQPVMIFFGSIPRFYLGEFRNHKGNGKSVAQPRGFIAVGSISILLSCAVFGVCAWDILSYTLENDGHDEWDKLAVCTIVLVQIGYPIAFIGSILYLHLHPKKYAEHSDTYPALLSFYKDVAYGTLDVVSKGGLALYAATRAAESAHGIDASTNRSIARD